MSRLPKFDIPGHVHFVTTNTNRFIPLFMAHDFCRILLNNVDFYRRKHGFELFGYVIMPDHFHALISPEHDVSISKIMQNIKGYAAKQILKLLGDHPGSWDELGGLVIPPDRLELACSTSARRCLRNMRAPTLIDLRVDKPRTKGQGHQVWQESFYDFNVYSERKLREKLNYMHRNPIAWRLVDDPGEYLYSSYQNYYSDGEKGLPIAVDYL